jgi:hypothetical protein
VATIVVSEAESGKQKTGYRRQGTGDRRQGAEDRRQKTEDGRQWITRSTDLNSMISQGYITYSSNKKMHFQTKIGHSATSTARCGHQKNDRIYRIVQDLQNYINL